MDNVKLCHRRSLAQSVSPLMLDSSLASSCYSSSFLPSSFLPSSFFSSSFPFFSFLPFSFLCFSYSSCLVASPLLNHLVLPQLLSSPFLHNRGIPLSPPCFHTPIPFSSPPHLLSPSAPLLFSSSHLPYRMIDWNSLPVSHLAWRSDILFALNWLPRKMLEDRLVEDCAEVKAK